MGAFFMRMRYHLLDSVACGARVLVRLLSCACLCGQVQAQPSPPSSNSPRWGVYATSSAEAWSNGVPVLALDGDWAKGYQQRTGSQHAYITGRAEAGAQFNLRADGRWAPWRLGVVARADASSRLSGQAAQVLYHYQSRTDPDQPVAYNADTDTLVWRGQGLALHAPPLHWGAFSLDLGWDHLTLKRMRALQSTGLVAYNADDSYRYQGQVRDDNSQTTQVFMQPPARTGVGDAVSVVLAWARPEAPDTPDGDAPGSVASWWPARARLTVDDAWSSLRWQGVNGDDAVLDSQVSQRTADGYIEYRAAINGQYTRRTLRARIPPTAQLQLAWPSPQGEWSLRLKHRLGLWQGWLGWQSPGAVAWQLACEPVAGAVMLGVRWQGLSASVMGSGTNQAAHARGVQLSGAWPF